MSQLVGLQVGVRILDTVEPDLVERLGAVPDVQVAVEDCVKSRNVLALVRFEIFKFTPLLLLYGASRERAGRLPDEKLQVRHDLLPTVG